MQVVEKKGEVDKLIVVKHSTPAVLYWNKGTIPYEISQQFGTLVAIFDVIFFCLKLKPVQIATVALVFIRLENFYQF